MVQSRFENFYVFKEHRGLVNTKVLQRVINFALAFYQNDAEFLRHA